MGLVFWMAALMVGAEPASAKVRDVVLTTDCGVEVDDQWALVHLALSAEVRLKLIVTTHAPTLKEPAAESSAKSARETLERLHLSEPPPVYAGSSRPLEDKARAIRYRGVEALIAEARRHSEEDRLAVIVIGAATDVASALILEPAVADRVEIVAMGFEAWPDGGDPWNVKNDVKAWQVVLESRAPTVVGDAKVTRKHLAMTPAVARTRFGGRGEAGAMLVGLLETWLAENPKLAESVSGAKQTWPIWDEVTVAYLLGMTRAESRPRPALRDDLQFDHSRPRGTIAWITSIDEARLWDDLAAKLDRAKLRPARTPDGGAGGRPDRDRPGP